MYIVLGFILQCINRVAQIVELLLQPTMHVNRCH